MFRGCEISSLVALFCVAFQRQSVFRVVGFGRLEDCCLAQEFFDQFKDGGYNEDSDCFRSRQVR